MSVRFFRTSFIAAAVSAGALLALACGSDGENDASNDPVDGGGGTPDADAPDGGDPTPPMEEGRRAVQGLNARYAVIGGGVIALTRGQPLAGDSGAAQSTTAAFFYDPALTKAFCTDRVLDGCRVSHCEGLTLTREPGPGLSAGPITLSGGGDGGVVTLSPGDRGRYTGGGTWAVGDRVAIAAEGDAVAAFSGAVELPESLVVEAPVFEGGSGFTVDRAVPLAVRWSGGGQAQVEVVFLQPSLTPGTDTINVVCRFPATERSGTISPAVLGELSAFSTAQFTIAAVDAHVVRAGDFEVHLEGASFPFFERASFR